MMHAIRGLLLAATFITPAAVLVLILNAVLLASPVLAGNSPASNDAGMLAGMFSNEEQVYFDSEAGRKGPSWAMLRITATGDQVSITSVDAFGAAKGPALTGQLKREGKRVVLDHGACERIYTPISGALVADGNRGDCTGLPAIARIGPYGLELAGNDGQVSDLRRARSVSCWVAVLRDKPKADGKEDWYFQRDVLLHDQGGRAAVGGGETGAQPIVIRVRNVTWDKGSTNRPVVALYAHKPDKPAHAEAYSWAAPDSARVGINLRWMQSGCNIGPVAPASQLTAEKFRG